jgi:hypothetical protein
MEEPKSRTNHRVRRILRYVVMFIIAMFLAMCNSPVW